MGYLLLLLACIVVSVTSSRVCDSSSFYDYSSLEDYTNYGYRPPKLPRPTKGPPPLNENRRTVIPMLMSTASPPRASQGSYQNFPSRPTPPRINTQSPTVPSQGFVVSRFGNDLNSVQQRQMRELYCLEVLDNLLSVRWQEEIDRISVSDLGKFSTLYKVPEFSNLYSNPESEWIQQEGMPLNKLDKCVRNLVSKIAPRMDQEEIHCLNRMYPEYLIRENRTARLYDKYIRDTSMEQLPFKSFYTYYELTELLFDNKNIDALDDEVRAIHEDMLDFYIKTEEDKSKKIFIVEQECEWKNARAIREVNNEDARFQKFGEQVKYHVNKYLFAEILQRWAPGGIIPDYRYVLWNKARQAMETEIQEKINELRKEKKDAQFLCTYAAKLATKFFEEQKKIIFDKMRNETLSANLQTRKKYAHIVGLEGALTGKYDDRILRVRSLLQEFKEGYYCLANFVKMIENHQCYAVAAAFVDETPPHGYTYCNIKEMSAELVQPRYCRCQGTFCEEFGLATVRAERFQLNLRPNNTYSVSTNSSYRIKPLDELIAAANQRIAGQKFNTWWYRHQKMPVKV
ncbi:uncharacterized protein LOC105689108 [Athalia rosae]|uniref:uncharacterized protein LOC105689108 n=1 Tax=Athalia rosae TaxID=37344 RepID=UPI0020345337|nr:uncharacterized protein LOC105689108 [Athalia rosae]